MITGGCFCGAIRYRIDDGTYPAANCHCTMCRRTSGAPYVAWLVVGESAFAITAGEPRILESSAGGRRAFCAHCGTPLVCTNADHPGIVDVTLGSLDDPERFPPQVSIHGDTALSWAHREVPPYEAS
ncbi:MAG TPA: GFA family protein [Pseudomonadales bacterium]|nr:GFA family protein [Pseudomonadales bacterium]